MRCGSHTSRTAGSCLALLFVLGVVLIPAWHQAYAEASAGRTPVAAAGGSLRSVADCPGPLSRHHTDHCTICHLIGVPVTSELEAPAVQPPLSIDDRAVTLPDIVPPPASRLLPFSCGPPA